MSEKLLLFMGLMIAAIIVLVSKGSPQPHTSAYPSQPLFSSSIPTPTIPGDIGAVPVTTTTDTAQSLPEDMYPSSFTPKNWGSVFTKDQFVGLMRTIGIRITPDVYVQKEHTSVITVPHNIKLGSFAVTEIYEDDQNSWVTVLMKENQKVSIVNYKDKSGIIRPLTYHFTVADMIADNISLNRFVQEKNGYYIIDNVPRTKTCTAVQGYIWNPATKRLEWNETFTKEIERTYCK